MLVRVNRTQRAEACGRPHAPSHYSSPFQACICNKAALLNCWTMTRSQCIWGHGHYSCKVAKAVSQSSQWYSVLRTCTCSRMFDSASSCIQCVRTHPSQEGRIRKPLSIGSRLPCCGHIDTDVHQRNPDNCAPRYVVEVITSGRGSPFL